MRKQVASFEATCFAIMHFQIFFMEELATKLLLVSFKLPFQVRFTFKKYYYKTSKKNIPKNYYIK